MTINRRTDNRRWKSIDDLWKDAFDDNVAALTVTMDKRALDAFGRQRVSSTGQRLDVEFLYDKQDHYFDEITNNGTVTHNGNTRDLTFSLSDANDGSYAKMQSFPVPYTPGNSQLIEMTGVLNLSDLEGTTEVFLRSKITGSVVEETIPRAQWNVFREDDELDFSLSQLFHMDFQSLKVGEIRFNIFKEGVLYPVAEMHQMNIRDSGYWQIPNGCAFWHLRTEGGLTYMEIGYGDENNAIGFRHVVTANANATMKGICCTVKSEGGKHLTDMTGLPRSASLEQTAKTVSTTLIPLLSIRPKATFNGYPNMNLTMPRGFTVQTSDPIRLVLLHDTTLTGAAWTDVSTGNSHMEYDVTASAVSGGHILHTDYLYSASTGSAKGTTASKSVLGKTPLWSRKNSVTGILTLAAIRTSTGNSSVLASMDWEELR